MGYPAHGFRPGERRTRPNLTLLRARMEREMSVDELARVSGLSAKQIRFIERGIVRDPHMETKKQLAHALGRDLLDLFPLQPPR